MAKKNVEETATEETEAKTGRGRKVYLESGEARVDYIRRRYYDDQIKRGDIARELSELTGQTVPYQIVFAATKSKTKDGDAPVEVETAAEEIEAA